MQIASNYLATNVYYTSNREKKNNGITNEKADFSKFIGTAKKQEASNKDSQNIITDQELYDRLVTQYGKDVNSIARELVKNKAVNPQNINPRDCTQLEMEILRESVNDGKPRSVKMDSHINFAMKYELGNGEMKRISDFEPSAKFDWIKRIQSFSKMQVDLGNVDFLNNGSYDAVNDYIEQLLSYGKNR